MSYERPEQPLDLITEVCTNIGLALGTEIHLALNCAASELMDYVSCSHWLSAFKRKKIVMAQLVETTSSEVNLFSSPLHFSLKESMKLQQEF